MANNPIITPCTSDQIITVTGDRDLAAGNIKKHTAETGKWREEEAFINVRPGYYWSNSTELKKRPIGWKVFLSFGLVYAVFNTLNSYVCPVWARQEAL